MVAHAHSCGVRSQFTIWTAAHPLMPTIISNNDTQRTANMELLAIKPRQVADTRKTKQKNVPPHCCSAINVLTFLL